MSAANADATREAAHSRRSRRAAGRDAIPPLAPCPPDDVALAALVAYMDSSRLQAFCRLWPLGTTAHVYPTSVVERICSGLDGLFARRRLIDLSCLGALRDKQAVPTSVRPVSHPRLGLRNRR